MTMAERIKIHKEIERQNELRRIDFLHGSVVDFRVTELADIWVHADGYTLITSAASVVSIVPS